MVGFHCGSVETIHKLQERDHLMSERLRPFRNFEGHEFSIIYNANNNVKNKVHPQAVVLESVHYTTTVFIF